MIGAYLLQDERGKLPPFIVVRTPWGELVLTPDRAQEWASQMLHAVSEAHTIEKDRYRRAN